MELDTPFVPELLLAGKSVYQYSCRRAIIESISTGEDVYVSEGQLTKQVIQPQIQGGFPPGVIQSNLLSQTFIQDERTFEGWRHL